ncbi:hypothetical protein HQ585_03045 [candidate division KSB1 bacterium]|nr:hypothetical protein [candidate division KSB1 bacterium]
MQNRNHIFSSITLIAAVGLLIFYGFTIFSGRSGRDENPFEYDVDSFKGADSSLIHYAEVQSIDFEGKKLTALTLNFKDELIVAAGREIFRIDSMFQSSLWITTQYPVRCLATDIEGLVYVGLENIVLVYHPDGSKQAEWDDFPRQAILTSIAVGDSHVYVADAGSRVVHYFNNSGKLITRLGEKDPVRNIPGFVIPSPYFDLCIAKNGSVWVVNPGRHTFENYLPSGDLVAQWGKTSMRIDGFSGCCNPTHIAMTPQGEFVTSEKGLERIKVYSPAGQLLSVVALPEQFDEGTVGLDLAVDSKGVIYVLDPSRERIRIFGKKEVS